MRNKVAVGFGLVLTVLVANAGLSLWNTLRLIEHDRQVVHTHEVIATLEEILSALKDAETGERGFLLTGDAAYLRPYRDAGARLPNLLRHLSELNTDDYRKKEIGDLHRLSDAKLAELDETIRSRDGPGGFEAALARVRTGEGKRLMDDLRQTASGMKGEEELLLRRRAGESKTSAWATLWTLASSSSLAVALLLLVYYLVRRDRAQRQQTAEQLRQEREWFEVTLLGVGDAVVATDRQGLVKLMNPVAQQLTGWRQEEATGRHVAEVFRVLNESNRQAMMNPVEKVLAAGRAIGLGSHTVLISRDGTERPIDESAAPIQDGRGGVAGVVLVFRDVSERRRVEEQLRQRNEQLAAADRRKDNFVAMLAHELRNPLAPIRNAATLLGLAGADQQTRAQALAMIERQVRHLSRLLDDLLDASRVANNKIQLVRARLDLGEVVRAVAEDNRPALESAGLALEVSIPPGTVWVEGDATRLAQVVSNLVHNAQKFTDPDGRVAVRLAVEPHERARVSVSDTGMGIEPEMQELLFQPFAQADRSLERSQGGLGLGLALVKGLVQMHGGEVRASSAGLGKGSEFVFWLPLAEAPAAPAPTPGPSPAGTQRRRVLIVEDNRDAADSLRLLLELGGGHAVAVAYSGFEGVELARGFRPDVVLCDLGLPGMSGFEVARALRLEPATAAARLIAVSGYGQAEDRNRARESGFDAALVKPVDPAVLERLLSEVISH